MPNASVPGVTVTEGLPGVDPDVGEILSQLPPLFVETVADQGMDAAPLAEFVTASVCAAGVPPEAAWKVSDVGDAASVPAGVTVSVTLIVTELDAAAEVI